jgi:hypothetical protein
MANCTTATNTLDPHQNLLDATEKTIGTLEKQSRDILPDVLAFRDAGNNFLEENISDPLDFEAALNEFTQEAICASKTDIAPIDEFTEDCLNDILRGVKKYLDDVLENVENGIDLIDSLLAIPENLLINLLQKIWKLCNNIQSLVSSIDGKIGCVTLSDSGSSYSDQVDALNARVKAVTDALYLDDDGSFNHTKLIAGFNSNLQVNLNAFKARSDVLKAGIESDIGDVLSTTSTVNPKGKY